MSAYIESKAHIGSILRTAYEGPADRGPRYPGDGWHRPYVKGSDGRYGTFGAFEVDMVGRWLITENVASVKYRYHDEPEETLPGPIDQWWHEDPLTFDLRQYRRLTAVECLKAISGLDYQSCEHPGWADSDAKAFLDALKDSLIGSLPGYDEADTWSIADEVPEWAH